MPDGATGRGSDDFDVVVVGGANAAFCAALSAQEQGARVAVLERAPEDEAGGNTRFTARAIRFAYRGPAPTVLLGASSAFCGYNLSVNGWEPVAIRPPEGRSELPLPSGPAPKGGWVVELVRRNENWQGVASFYGLRMPAGCELIAPPPLPKRKLMFIGDSITCGEAIDRVPYIGVADIEWRKAETHRVGRTEIADHPRGDQVIDLISVDGGDQLAALVFHPFDIS